jgi:AAA domain, putative AbiEii toxin, Type IV TA system
LLHDRTIRSTNPLFSRSPSDSRPLEKLAPLFIGDVDEATLQEIRMRTVWKESSRMMSQQMPAGLYLQFVIDALGTWFRDSALQQSSSGDQDSSIVFLNMIKTLSHGSAHSKLANKGELLSQLKELQQTAAEYGRYGLVGEYHFANFIDIVDRAPTSRVDDIATILNPYINSVRSRFNAISDIKILMASFQGEINNYLKDKYVEIHLGRMMRFFDSDGKLLSPEDLSSGEQQLAFLFCASMLSRVGSTIFIVDEPELSLNVKWQRRLLSSLMSLASGARTQFVVATHSIEIMSQHRNALGKLG